MGIKDFLERMRQKKGKYKDFEDEQKIQEKYVERKKSSNERELERFRNEDREDNIKSELEACRAKRKEKNQYGNQITKVKNMFAPQHSHNEILNNDKLFTGRSSLFNQEKGGFFK